MMRLCSKILFGSLALLLVFSLTLKAYAADENNPNTADFAVLFSDTDEAGGSGLALCEYKVESSDPVNGWVETHAWDTRTCNTATPNITVGPTVGKDCQNQGDHTCRVTGRSIDNAGNVSAESAKLFSIALCVPPVSGDWEIVAECILQDESYILSGNIIIQSTGILDMRGTTNLTFDNTAARYIYVYPGGKVYQDGTAGFNK